MRPPVSATPPISHMISQRARPATFNWSTLTSDNSIQILHLNSVDHTLDENFFESCGLTDPMKYKTSRARVISTPSPIHKVSAFYSQRQEEVDEPVWVKREVEEPVWVKRQPDNSRASAKSSNVFKLSSAMFYNPDSEATPLNDLPVWANIDINQNDKTLTRVTHSDSDIEFRKEHTHMTKVSRSMSLGYADYKARNKDTSMLRPLRPCVNKTKVGNVKRLSCAASKTTVAMDAIPEFEPKAKTLKESKVTSSNKTSAKEIGSRKTAIKQTESLRLPSLMDAQKTKIANFVKSGLKNLMKNSKDSFDVNADQSSKVKSSETTAYRKRRNKLMHRATDIGGLSDFLRKNERRKTARDFPSSTTKQDDKSNKTHSKSTEEKPATASNVDISHAHTVDKPSLNYTPKPWSDYLIGTNSNQSVYATNFKFAKCQRELVFQGDDKTDEADFKALSSAIEPQYNVEQVYESNCTDDVTNADLPRKPRLGLLGHSQPVTCMPLDQLEMDVVRDLKRRMEKANRASRIKTNGSLMRPKLGHTFKPCVTSPKRTVPSKNSRLFSNASLGIRRVKLKQESFV